MEDLRIPVNDESGSVVKDRFQAFLQNYQPSDMLEGEPTHQYL